MVSEVKNKRQRISPGGIVTLPVAARKSLGFEKGQKGRVTVAVEGNAVHIAAAGRKGGFPVSANGQLHLRGEARDTLQAGKASHYWIALDDKSKKVVLKPY